MQEGMLTDHITLKEMHDMMKSLVESKAFWAREATICAMMDVLAPQKTQLPYELAYYESMVRKAVPLESDKRA